MGDSHIEEEEFCDAYVSGGKCSITGNSCDYCALIYTRDDE